MYEYIAIPLGKYDEVKWKMQMRGKWRNCWKVK